MKLKILQIKYTANNKFIKIQTHNFSVSDEV